MLLKHRKRRVPSLSFTKCRNIGWHVNFRDAKTGISKRHRFGMVSREAAEQSYHEWAGQHLRGIPHVVNKTPRSGHRKMDFGVLPERVEIVKSTIKAAACESKNSAQVVMGSLLHVASGLLKHEEARTRIFGEVKRQGTIHPGVLVGRKQAITDFLEFLNGRYGHGAVGKMTLADLTMIDVEEYNRLLVKAEYSGNVVAKQMQAVKNIIDRAGRPEYCGQVLTWNWDSRDVHHGAPTKKRLLPTVSQLRTILSKCDLREKAIIWMAIGMGFGQFDLSVVRVGQIDEKSYDLRRNKTGIERYGETPPMVWKSIQAYLKEVYRSEGDLMFVTRKGMPVVHGSADSIQQWWFKQKKTLGDEGKLMTGFYSLRHLGATEYGSRPGCSISDMKRWLGHGASSQMADVYMKPVSPETREVIEFVRETLATGKTSNPVRI